MNETEDNFCLFTFRLFHLLDISYDLEEGGYGGFVGVQFEWEISFNIRAGVFLRRQN